MAGTKIIQGQGGVMTHAFVVPYKGLGKASSHCTPTASAGLSRHVSEPGDRWSLIVGGSGIEGD